MKKHNKFTKMLLTMVLILSIVIGNIPMAFAANENNPKGYITMSVEKFTLGLGYIKEPVRVPFYEGENLAEVLVRFLGEGNYKNTGTPESAFYLSKIKDTDDREVNIHPSISEACGYIGKKGDKEWLGEFDYSGMSGWMYCVDSKFAGVGASDWTLEDGQTVRWQFTLALGQDLGDDRYGMPPLVTIANKDLLTSKIADINSAANKSDLLGNVKIKEAYDNSYKVLEKIDAEQTQVDDALLKLNEALNSNPEIPEENPEVPGSPEVVLPSVPVNQAIEDTSSVLYNNTPDPKIGTLGGDWTILSLARNGYNIPKGYYDKYYENVSNELKEKNGVLHNSKYTEYSRVILGLSSIGKDVTNVGGYNLLEKLADFNAVTNQGINGPIFALIALDCNNYEIPVVESVKKQSTRDNLIEYILDKEIKQQDGTPKGGWTFRGNIADVDMTAMALQALAKYKDSTITKEDGTIVEVAPYIERGLTVLSELQTENGKYKENCESIAQVIVALTALGIDPKTDERFVKGNGNWTISAMMDFYVEGGGFKHTLNENSMNAMATDQGSYALAAYKRFVKGENSLYDMTDAFEGDSSVGPIDPVEGEVVIKGPNKILGKKGTEFSITLNSKAWPEGEYKLLDAVMNIPSQVEVSGIEVGSTLAGGLPDFGVSENTLRLVYSNTELKNIGFGEGEIITINCKLTEDVNESLSFKLNEFNLKSSSDSVTEMTVDRASHKIEVGESGEVDPPGPSPEPTPELAQVKVLYEGDGTDLIPNDKKAVAVSFLNVDKTKEVKFGEGVTLYYSEELTNELSNTTYVALVEKSISTTDLSSIDKYKFNKDVESESIKFGDTDNDTEITAQDALNTLTAWLRKSDVPNDKGILVMNVTRNSKIDTSDTLAIMENYTSDKQFLVLAN